MYDYHANLVWAVDKALFIIALGLTTLIIINAIVNEYLRRRRSRALLNIKKHVYEILLAGQKIDEKSLPPVISGATPQQFLDVATNRDKESIFFNNAEQELFKKHFIAPRKIKKLKAMIGGVGKKWRKIEAIMCLGYAGITDSVDMLKRALLSKDEDISYFSMIALGQIKTRESAAALLNLFRRAPSARYKLISVLENFPDFTGDMAVELTHDGDPGLRTWATKLVSKFSIKDRMKRVKELARDESPEVRAAACECIGRSEVKKEEDLLVSAMKDDSWLVRESAIKALNLLLGKDSIQHVIKMSGDGSLSVLDAVKDVMAAHIEEALPYIEKLFQDNDTMAKKISLAALEESGYLIKILNNILVGTEKEKGRLVRLLAGLISSDMHLGVIWALQSFNKEAQASIIKNIQKADEPLADRILEHLRSEPNR